MNSRGETSLGLSLVFLAVVFCLLFSRCACRYIAGNEGAIEEAKVFAGHLPDGKDAEIECAGYDSDGDGYVSCTIFREGQEPLFVECSRKTWTLTKGCRGQKAVSR